MRKGAAMTERDIKGHIISLWMNAAILIWVASMVNASLAELTERVDALEQSETSEAQR
jgi:hypothetical protein